MAFDLNKKKEENKKFNLTKSEDSLSDLNSTNEKKDDKSESDVKRSKFDLTKDSTVIKDIPDAGDSFKKPLSESSNGAKKSKSVWLISLTLLAVIGGIWYFTNNSNNSPLTNASSTNIPAESENQSTQSVGASSATEDGANTTSLKQESTDTLKSIIKNEGGITEDQGTPANSNPRAENEINSSSTSANTAISDRSEMEKKQSSVSSSASKVSNEKSSSSNSSQSLASNSITNNQNKNVAPAKDVKISKSKQDSKNSIADNQGSLDEEVPASFNSGSSSFSNINEDVVIKWLKYLKDNPAGKILVNGYSSSEGDLNFNNWLSEKRANVFKAYLVSKGGSSNSIIAIGKGIENPIGTNDNEEGRRQNRRVEITVQ